MEEEELSKQEKEFLASWEEMEDYFKQGFPKALQIIRILRERGFDTKTFASQGLYDLILTNKGGSGFYNNKSRIVLCFTDVKMRDNRIQVFNEVINNKDVSEEDRNFFKSGLQKIGKPYTTAKVMACLPSNNFSEDFQFQNPLDSCSKELENALNQLIEESNS